MNINALHESAQTGDHLSEKRLFESLSVRFRMFVRRKIDSREDCEEVVQEALMGIARKYKDTDFQTSFIAWAHGVLQNEILRYYRRKGLQDRRFGQPVEPDFLPGPADPDVVLRKKLLDCLDKVNQSNRRYARVLNLHYLGFTTAEVCSKLKLSENNSYVILSRARTMLEICLETGDIN